MGAQHMAQGSCLCSAGGHVLDAFVVGQGAPISMTRSAPWGPCSGNLPSCPTFSLSSRPMQTPVLGFPGLCSGNFTSLCGRVVAGEGLPPKEAPQ